MMKKVIKRRKQKVSKLLRRAKANDLSLSFYLSLLNEVKEIKQARKKAIKYGTYHDWYKTDQDGVFLSVPVYSKKDNSLLHYEVFFEKAYLPEYKQYLWLNKLVDKGK